MSEKSSTHVYTEWAKGRLDEMDAAVTSLQSSVDDLQAQARDAGEKALAEMRAKRDAFKAQLEANIGKGEGAWADAQSQMLANWNAFEAAGEQYVNAATEFVEQQSAAVRARSEAQLKAWNDSIAKLQDAAAKIHADTNAELQQAMARMKGETEAARARMESLQQAGSQSWTAFMTALAESRTAFEKMSEVAYDAFKRAGK